MEHGPTTEHSFKFLRALVGMTDIIIKPQIRGQFALDVGQVSLSTYAAHTVLCEEVSGPGALFEHLHCPRLRSGLIVGKHYTFNAWANFFFRNSTDFGSLCSIMQVLELVLAPPVHGAKHCFLIVSPACAAVRVYQITRERMLDGIYHSLMRGCVRCESVAACPWRAVPVGIGVLRVGPTPGK